MESNVTIPDTAFANLQAIAARVCWWQPAKETLSDTPLFLCRVMALGTWDDTVFCLGHFGRDAFRSALRSAPPGIIDIRSWHYWHHRFGMIPVPPIPIRTFPA
jgi:hypothetical protein